MPKRQRTPAFSVDKWEIELLRLTAFPIQASPVSQTNWWATLTGQQPEKTITQPKLATVREEGPFLNGTLVSVIQPNRIDWALAPPQNPPGEDFPGNIGTLPKSLESFIQLMQKWLDIETIPSLQRLAFGANLGIAIENKEMGYSALATYLPFVKLDPINSSDFFYQINRPRNSTTIAGLLINRLSKWSVARLIGVQIALEKQPSAYSTHEKIFRCHLELDINTEETRRQPLPAMELARVFKELTDIGCEIAEKGDVA